jgi:hypothetical protein
MKQVHRISKARQRQAAAGKKNLAAWLASKEVEPDIRAEAKRFESELLAELGVNPIAGRRALVASAAASYLVVSLAKNKLLRQRRWRRSTDSLIDLLGRAQGQLSRALRALGLTPQDAPDTTDEPPRGGLRDYLATREMPKEDANGDS